MLCAVNTTALRGYRAAPLATRSRRANIRAIVARADAARDAIDATIVDEDVVRRGQVRIRRRELYGEK